MSKKCTHCNIIVLDDTEYCPFCHHVLQKEENGTHQTEVKNRYPDIAETVRRVSIARRILLYLAVAIGVICLFTNYRTYDGLLWSLIVIYGLIYAVIIVSLFSSEKLGAYGKEMVNHIHSAIMAHSHKCDSGHLHDCRPCEISVVHTS